MTPNLLSRQPPAEKTIRLSRWFCRRLSRDHNDLHGVKVVIIQQCTLCKTTMRILTGLARLANSNK